MKARWLMMTLLLHSAVPALAQLDHDPANDPPVHDAPPVLPKHVIAASQVNAGTAVVSPEGGRQKDAAKRPACSDKNPCAVPTPAAR